MRVMQLTLEKQLTSSCDSCAAAIPTALKITLRDKYPAGAGSCGLCSDLPRQMTSFCITLNA